MGFYWSCYIQFAPCSSALFQFPTDHLSKATANSQCCCIISTTNEPNNIFTSKNGPPQRSQRHSTLPSGIHLCLSLFAAITLISFTSHSVPPILQQPQHIHSNVRNSPRPQHHDNQRRLQTPSRQICSRQQ